MCLLQANERSLWRSLVILSSALSVVFLDCRLYSRRSVGWGISPTHSMSARRTFSESRRWRPDSQHSLVLMTSYSAEKWWLFIGCNVWSKEEFHCQLTAFTQFTVCIVLLVLLLISTFEVCVGHGGFCQLTNDWVTAKPFWSYVVRRSSHKPILVIETLLKLINHSY